MQMESHHATPLDKGEYFMRMGSKLSSLYTELHAKIYILIRPMVV